MSGVVGWFNDPPPTDADVARSAAEHAQRENQALARRVQRLEAVVETLRAALGVELTVDGHALDERPAAEIYEARRQGRDPHLP